MRADTIEREGGLAPLLLRTLLVVVPAAVKEREWGIEMPEKREGASGGRTEEFEGAVDARRDGEILARIALAVAIVAHLTATEREPVSFVK